LKFQFPGQAVDYLPTPGGPYTGQLINLLPEVAVMSNEADTKCVRGLTLMTAGLFGVFVSLLVLAQVVVH
jgi:hypothetical protein